MLGSDWLGNSRGLRKPEVAVNDFPQAIDVVLRFSEWDR